MKRVGGLIEESAISGPEAKRPGGQRPVLRAPSTPLGRAVLALLVLHLLIRGWIVSGSYYFQDDYNHLSLARELGLSKAYLIRDYGGHLEPGQYFLIWVFSHFTDESFVFATVTVIAMQAVASLLLWVVLRELFGQSPVLLIPWAMYLFTPLALAWSTWWAAAIQALPLQICLLVAILGLARAQRSPGPPNSGRRWRALSILASACALLLWEKGVFVLPALIAVQVLVIAPGSLGARIASLRLERRMWLAQGALVASYVVVYSLLVDSVADTRGTDLRALLDGSVTRMLVPGLFGGPWHVSGALGTVYPYTETVVVALSLLALAGLVWLSVRVSGPVAFAGWLLAAAYVAADLALLAVGRGDYLSFLARDPRYVADALPIIAIGFAAAFRGLGERPGPEMAQKLRKRLTLKVSLGISLALLISGLITQVQLAPVVQHDDSRDYTETLLQELQAEPDLAVVNTATAFAVSARTDLEGLLRAVGAEYRFDRPGTRMYMADASGALTPVLLLDGGEQTFGPVAGCGWVVAAEPIPLTAVNAIAQEDAESHDLDRLVLRLTYAASSRSVVGMTVGGQEQRVSLDGGIGDVYFVVPNRQDEVQVRVIEGEPICVSATAVGEPWVE